MKPKTLADAIQLFASTEEVVQNPQVVGNLESCLKHYVFHQMGIPCNSSTEFQRALDSTSLHRIASMKLAFQRAYDVALQKGKSAGTMRNYRSALVRFIDWVQGNGWLQKDKPAKEAPRMNLGYNYAESRKGGRKLNKDPYGLKPGQLPTHIAKELDELHHFLTAPHIPKRQDPKIRETTWTSAWRRILSFLGWLHHHRGIAMEDLRLSLLADVETLDEFVAWGINERGNQFRWGMDIAVGSLHVAKWLNYKDSKRPQYRDIDIIEEIRVKILAYKKMHKINPGNVCTQENLLPFDQSVKVVNYLKECTLPQWANSGTDRPDHIIITAWQKYLAIALLTYVPIRQREIRELELNRTLFRGNDGYIVRLSPDDHKTGSKTGKSREFRLPSLLTNDLDTYIKSWLGKVEKSDQKLFFSLSKERYGQPLNNSQFHRIVTRTMYRFTGVLFGEPRAVRPHDFRRIAITWQRQYGDPGQREALAELMGHSVQIADMIYSQLSSLEKTDMAREWWVGGS